MTNCSEEPFLKLLLDRWLELKLIWQTLSVGYVFKIAWINLILQIYGTQRLWPVFHIYIDKNLKHL